MVTAKKDLSELDYDYAIVGSGFGGAVSALRLSEKGYRVLVLEMGKELKEGDFPESNWNLRRWLWMPFFRFFGLFRLTFFRHVTVLSGVGVGGGSLVYANTLPVPKKEFFEAPSWAHLANWEEELKPFYQTASTMLGATKAPREELGDKVLRDLAREMGREDLFESTRVGVYFGEPEKKVEDPYFGGRGPERTGCVFCGGCMLGCRHGAKNTLDKNYLYLARQYGATIQAESEVYDVLPLEKEDGSLGYQIKYRSSTSFFPKGGEITAKGIVFSAGVLGTMKLLLKLKKNSLPRLSDQLGKKVRTNNESIVAVTTYGREKDCSAGIAISSIFHPDENSHLEVVRYSPGAGAWRFIVLPMIQGKNIFIRMFKLLGDLFRHPLKNLKVMFTDDWALRTQILLFMQHLDSTLSFTRGWFGMKTALQEGEKPSAFIPEASELAEKYSHLIGGKPQVLFTETLLGIPSTAHILGGATMGKDRGEGVIDRDHRVFGYENMLIIDGSTISANPGVNPSLTITALSERAMSKIEPKKISYQKDPSLNNRQGAFLRYSQVGRKITSGAYAKKYKVSTTTALKDLKDLEGRGFLLQQGKGRGTTFELIRK